MIQTVYKTTLGFDFGGILNIFLFFFVFGKFMVITKNWSMEMLEPGREAATRRTKEVDFECRVFPDVLQIASWE